MLIVDLKKQGESQFMKSMTMTCSTTLTANGYAASDALVVITISVLPIWSLSQQRP